MVDPVVRHQRLRTWFVIKNRKKESLTYDTFAIIENANILFDQNIIEQLNYLYSKCVIFSR